MKSRADESQGYNTEHTYRVQQGSVKLQHYGRWSRIVNHKQKRLKSRSHPLLRVGTRQACRSARISHGEEH